MQYSVVALGVLAMGAGCRSTSPSNPDSAVDAPAADAVVDALVDVMPDAPPVPMITQDAYIKASNPKNFAEFGSAVALSSDGLTLVVGAPQEDSGATGVDGNQADTSGNESGAVYVFTRPDRQTLWSQQAYIKPSNTHFNEHFANALALSADGNVLAVGAYFEYSGATGVNGDDTSRAAPTSGAVFVFRRAGTTWSQDAYLKASNTDYDDQFGTSVAISADGATIAIGAPKEQSNARTVDGDQTDNSLTNAGAVYVFVHASTWAQTAYVKAWNTIANEWFGTSVALSANASVLAVGAQGDASGATGIDHDPFDTSRPFAGAVFVFSASGTTWTPQAYVKASNPDPQDGFGMSVALSSDSSTLVVGSEYEASSAEGIDGDQTSNASANAGAAYVFVSSNGAWTQQAYVKPSDHGGYFGKCLGLSSDGSRLLASAYYAGAAYLFTRAGATWSQQAFIKGSNTEGDAFGFGVAVSGDGRTLAVGAQMEQSTASGVDGSTTVDAAQSNNLGTFVGAAYTFQ